MRVPGMPYCYDHTEGNIDDPSGGHNSNNDAYMARAMWDFCVLSGGDYPREGSPEWATTCRHICGGPGEENRATCSGIPGVSENSEVHLNGTCDAPYLLGTSDPKMECRTDATQPICATSDLWVCGVQRPD
jgi:hypothetical protein